MRENEAIEHWCPLGRISIQRQNNTGQVEVVDCGSFNMAVVHAAENPALQGEWARPSRCVGRRCALWRPGMISKSGILPPAYARGQCGLVRPRRPVFGTVVIAGAVVMAMLRLFNFI